MKTAKLFAVALTTLTSVCLFAQQADVTAQQKISGTVTGSQATSQVNGSAGVSAQANSGGAGVAGSGAAATAGSVNSVKGVGALDTVSGSANGSAPAAAEMHSVNGELVGKLDSKTAKAGDQVVLKTTESTKTADGTVIPKGTRLVGHVTSVQAHGSGTADSQMGIQFDRAELKGGQSLPIHSEIRSVTPSASAMAASSVGSEDALGAGSMGGGARAMGGARAGGGLLGGGAGGSVRNVSQTTARAGSGLGSSVNETAHASGHVAGNAASSAGGHANLATGAASGVAAHATGVRGVMLAGDASGRASGTLSATKQNVHLDSGTQMELGVSSAAK